MTENRIPRELDARDLDERPKMWQPASILPEPDKKPGYAYRWIRISTLGSRDPRNISGKLREGWEPVRIEEQPQFRMLVDSKSEFKDNIEVAGLLLCKTPTDFMRQRKAHYSQITRNQMSSVDNSFMRENDKRMPLFSEKKSTVSFGKGN